MFDIGWQELFVIAVLAILVVGPKDIPQAFRAVAKVVRGARGLAREFQSGVEEMMREAELDEIKRKANQAANFDLDEQINKVMDPTGTLTEDFDPEDFRRELKERVEGAGASERPPPAPNERGASGGSSDEGAADAGGSSVASAAPSPDATLGGRGG